MKFIMLYIIWNHAYFPFHKQYSTISLFFIPSKDGSKVTNEPFRGVEAQDADSMVRLQSQPDESLGHDPDLLIVLLVGGGLPLTTSLHTHSIGVGISGKDNITSNK